MSSVCFLLRLYQTHLKDSQEKISSKAAAARQAASQPTKQQGNQREAGLRAAMMAPLSSNVGHYSRPSGAASTKLSTLQCCECRQWRASKADKAYDVSERMMLASTAALGL